MPTQREVIRFDAEPVKVTLDKGPHGGIECHGQYGIDWRYSVNHGKGVMYLPAEAREALLDSGAGEDVAIRRLGKARWEVERIAPDLPFPLASRGSPGGRNRPASSTTFGNASLTGTAVRPSRTAASSGTAFRTRARCL